MARVYDCPRAGCEFSLRTDDRDELVEHVRLHADERHGVWLSHREVLDLVRETTLVKD